MQKVNSERFEPNTVLLAFHTIQASSSDLDAVRSGRFRSHPARAGTIATEPMRSPTRSDAVISRSGSTDLTMATSGRLCRW